MVLISLSDTRCVNVPLAICQTFTQSKLQVHLSVVPVHLSADEAKNVRQRAGISFPIARLYTLRSDVDKPFGCRTQLHCVNISLPKQYNTLHYITLHYIRYITLHYITPLVRNSQNATRVEELRSEQIT